MNVWINYRRDANAESKSYDESKLYDEKPNIICEIKSFCILLSIVLLIVTSIYSYLIESKAKQKHLFPFYIKNNQLKEILY